MPLSSHCSYESPVYFKSKLYTVLIDFWTCKMTTLAPGFALFLKDEHLSETSKISNTFFDLLPLDPPNNTTTKLHFIIWDASGLALSHVEWFWWRIFDTISCTVSSYVWQWQIAMGLWPVYYVWPMPSHFIFEFEPMHRNKPNITYLLRLRVIR